MYYDLMASLPHLPHFERAERLPISRLRLEARLRVLQPAHAGQLAQAQSLVRWRPDRLLGKTDAGQANQFAALAASPLEPSLSQYVAFRMDQQTLLAALRRKQAGLALPEAQAPWGVGPWVRHIQRHWDEPDFRLARLYPWLPQARDLLASGEARALDRLLMEAAWRWLDRRAEQDMFRFEAVFSFYCFKWDILQAWLACDADKGKTRFRDLIDKVTHVEHS